MRAAAVLCLALTSCSSAEPTLIDGSSDEAFARTAEAARDDLPAADRLLFDEALNTVGARRYASDDAQALARTTFDGMTANEVLADYRARR